MKSLELLNSVNLGTFATMECIILDIFSANVLPILVYLLKKLPKKF